jgi:hypothetical protein
MTLLFCIYVAFVVFTDPSHFGLTIQPDGHATWVAVRLLTFGLWLALAALLLGLRRSPVAWRSFAYAFLATCALAVTVASSLVPAAANHVSVAGSIGMYAMATGFVCITVARPLHALAIGALLFPAQLLLDTTGHFLSGQFRLH